MALEDMILLKEGAYSLARYKRKWREQRRNTKLRELPPEDRAIIEPARANQRDFPAPPRGEMASQPKGGA